MKKRLKFLVAMVFATLLSANVFAYDFVVNGIYYDINSDGTTVSVTYQSTNLNSYSGSVTIPSTVTYNGTTYSVTSIGEEAFRDCTGLTSVSIPNSVTTIGGGAFASCTGLTSVSIPNSVTSIGASAFAGCTGLTSITIPNSVTSIGGGAFGYCTGLTSITIPNSVTSIGGWAFSDCTGLTSVTIPNSVTTIDYWAFLGCTGLTSVSIPNSVTSIGGGAFYNCTGLTSITIPNSVTTIDYWAFGYCTGLTTINYNAVNCSGDGFSYDNYDSFHWLDGCDNITTVNIGDSVQTIPPYFMCRKSGLTSVTIPNSVTTIGEYAFRDCEGLDIVTIGSGVTEIRNNAFEGCGSIDTIYSMPAVPPTIYSNTFNNVYRGIPLYVPCGTLEDYSSATYWREFTNIQEYCENGSVVVETRVATDITDTTATLNGEINIEGNLEILAQGFEWKELNATSYNVVNVSGTILTEVLTGLTPNTTYTYRAFATTSNETQYGEDVVFTTLLNSGINDVEKENTINVYPNPTSDNATLIVKGLNEEAAIVVTDQAGRVISTAKLAAGQESLEISSSALASGVYYIRIQTANSVRTEKLIKR